MLTSEMIRTTLDASNRWFGDLFFLTNIPFWNKANWNIYPGYVLFMRDKLSIEYVLLGSLMPGPRHGYEIMQFLDSSLDSTWRVGTSQLYALLKRLEQGELLQSGMETQETRPSKRVFSLTEAGKKRFLDWINTPTTRIRYFRLEFLSKLFFFHLLSLEGGSRLVESQIRVMKGQREKIAEKERHEKEPFQKLVYGFKLKTVESYLDILFQVFHSKGQMLNAFSFLV